MKKHNKYIKGLGVIIGVLAILGGILASDSIAAESKSNTMMDITLSDSLNFIFDSEKTTSVATLNAQNNIDYANVNIDKIEVQEVNGFSLVSNTRDFTKESIDSQNFSMILKEKNYDLKTPYKTQIPLTNLNYEMHKGVSSKGISSSPANIIYTLSLDFHEYNIQYNVDGGTMPSTYPTTYTYEKETILPTPTKTDYKFLGWSEEVPYTYSAASDWIKSDNGWVTQKGASAIQTRAPEGQAMSAPLNLNFTLANSALIEFDMSFNYGGNSAISNPYYKIYKNGTLYKEYQLSTEGENVQCSESLEKGTYKIEIVGAYSYNASTNDTYDNTTVENLMISQFISVIPQGQTGEKVLTANWEAIPVYNILYNLNGGTLPEGAVTSYTGKEEVKLPTPTKTDYEFLGWSEEVPYTYSAEKHWDKTNDGWKVNSSAGSISRAVDIGDISSPLFINFSLKSNAKLNFGMDNQYTNADTYYKIYKNNVLLKEVKTSYSDNLCNEMLDIGNYKIEIVGCYNLNSTIIKDFSIIYSNPYDIGNWIVEGDYIKFGTDNCNNSDTPPLNSRAADFPTGSFFYNNIPFTLNSKSQLSFSMQEGTTNPNRGDSSFYLVKDGMIIDSIESVDMTNEIAYSKILEAGEYKLYFKTDSAYSFTDDDFRVRNLSIIPFVSSIPEKTQGDKVYTANYEKLPTYNIDYKLNGGTLPEGAVTSYTGKEEAKLPTPTKTGYEFLGWSEEVPYQLGKFWDVSDNGDLLVSSKYDNSSGIHLQESTPKITPRAPSEDSTTEITRSLEFKLTNPALLSFEYDSKIVLTPAGSIYGGGFWITKDGTTIYSDEIKTAGWITQGTLVCSLNLEAGDYAIHFSGKATPYELSSDASGTVKNLSITEERQVSSIPKGSTGDKKFSANWKEKVLSNV